MNARLPRHDLFSGLGKVDTPKPVKIPAKVLSPKEIQEANATENVHEDQLKLIDEETWQEKEWKGMPEYKNNHLSAYRTITVHFLSKNALDTFIKLIGQNVSDNRDTITFPRASRDIGVYRDES
jgi:hypothetical protein